MKGDQRVALAVAVATIVCLGIGIPLALRGDGGPAETPPRPPTTTVPERVTALDTHALPERVPGVRLEPITLRTYRLSLVFRLRNTILNGLAGSASDHVVDTAQARIGVATGLLIGIAARTGADPPAIPAAIAGLIGVDPVSRRCVAGLPVTLFPADGYRLALVDGGPRRAIVVIAESRAQAARIAGAVARAVRRDRVAPCSEYGPSRP